MFVYVLVFFSKRVSSVSPVIEPEQNRTVNNLKDDKEQKEEKDPFKNFTVSYESDKLSKKTKKAVNCLNKKDDKSKASTVESFKNKPNKARDKPVKDGESVAERIDCDAVSENAFNHMKEESRPAQSNGQLPDKVIRKSRSESMNNTLKQNNNPRSRKSPFKSKSDTRQKLTSGKQRNTKKSAKTRNLNLIKSKLKMHEVESKDVISETSTDSDTSTMYISSEEESVIDTSIVQSGDEDVITDDEDSAADYHYPKVRKANFHASKRQDIKESQRIDVSKSDDGQNKGVSNLSCEESSIVGDANLRESSKVTTGETWHMETTTGEKSHMENIPLNNLNSYSLDNKVSKHAKNKAFVADLNLENDSDTETNQYLDSKIKSTNIKLVDTMKCEHVPRKGPIASSSFKSEDNNKNKLRNKESDLDNKISFNNDFGIHATATDEQETQKLVNYLQFKDAVMKDGRVNLNRSMSLNEGEQFKINIESKRKRKRKYTSLRVAKKESVFDAIQTLEKEPKKGILKKSKSLLLDKRPNLPDANIEKRTSRSEQLLPKETRYDKMNGNTDAEEFDAPDRLKRISDLPTENNTFCEILSSNLQTATDTLASNDDTPLCFQLTAEKSSKQFAQYSADNMKCESSIQRETNMNFDNLPEGSDEERYDQIVNESRADLTLNQNIANKNKGRQVMFNFDNVSPSDDKNIENMKNVEPEWNKTFSNFDSEKNENQQDKTSDDSCDLPIFEKRNKEADSDKEITMPNCLEEQKSSVINSPTRDQKHFKETDIVQRSNPSHTQETEKKGSLDIYIPKHLEDIDSSLELIEINSTSEDTTELNDNLNDNFISIQNAYECTLPVITNGKEFGSEQSNECSELADVSTRPDVALDNLEVTSFKTKDLCTHSAEFREAVHFDLPMNKDKKGKSKLLFCDKQSNIEFTQHERPKTPHPTSDGFKMPPTTKLLNKVVRHKSNPSFDKAHVEMLQLQKEFKSISNQSSQNHKSKSLSPIAKKDANSLPQNISLPFPPKSSDNYMTHESITSKPTSIEEGHASKSDENTRKIMQMKRSNSSNPIHAISPLTKDRSNRIAKTANSKANAEVEVPVNKSKENKDEHERMQSPLFHLRNDTIRMRSKTPSVDIERTSRNHHESKRSKTPMPTPTYLKDQSDTSIVKPLIHPLSKLKTGYTKNANMETFSRNFPSVLEEKRCVAVPFRGIRRFPNRNVPVLENTNINEHKLLDRREKDRNILNERTISKREPVIERPKSAMSMRSAPRLTTMENVTPLPRKLKSDNSLRPKSGGYRTSVTSTPAQDDQARNSKGSNSRGSDVLNVRQSYDIGESDSELEEFFANPDVESLQFGNQDLLKNGYSGGSHRTVFTTYRKKNDLTKSRSFKM